MPVDHLNHRFHRLVGLWLFTTILVSVAWWWFAVTPVPLRPPVMEFAADRHAENIAVCPGDTIPYAIDLVVTQPGVFAIDISVWRITPPAVVLFSEVRRVVFSEPTSYTVKRQWVVPPTYVDPITSVPATWGPGQYERRHAITVMGRDAEPSFAVIPFTIRSDCK